MAPAAGPDALGVRVLRTLALQAPTSPGGRLYLAAASGLVRAGDHWHVVADDELHLGVFAGHGEAPGRLVRLLPGELPAEPRPRKKQKPDLEALVRLPSVPGLDHGALLALGSGSKAGRMTGALLPLSAAGEALEAAEPVDLADLYRELANHFPRVNIEGAVIVGGELWLMQRGNHGNVGVNALVRVPLASVLRALGEDRTLGNGARVAIQPARLGEVPGAAGPVPLCFTDGAALPDGGMVFTAVAEDTEDPVLDGPCLASAVGCLDARGELRWLRHLQGAPKVEGIEVLAADGAALELRLVTDADDPAQPAHLLAVTASR